MPAVALPFALCCRVRPLVLATAAIDNGWSQHQGYTRHCSRGIVLLELGSHPGVIYRSSGACAPEFTHQLALKLPLPTSGLDRVSSPFFFSCVKSFFLDLFIYIYFFQLFLLRVRLHSCTSAECLYSQSKCEWFEIANLQGLPTLGLFVRVLCWFWLFLASSAFVLFRHIWRFNTTVRDLLRQILQADQCDVYSMGGQ